VYPAAAKAAYRLAGVLDRADDGFLGDLVQDAQGFRALTPSR
jgi:hypothetical protein